MVGGASVKSYTNRPKLTDRLAPSVVGLVRLAKKAPKQTKKDK